MNTGSGYTGTPSGSYTLALSFYKSNDCTGNLLYFCAEQVNVFDNLTTDTWINSGSSYMKTDSLGKTENRLKNRRRTCKIQYSEGFLC